MGVQRGLHGHLILNVEEFVRWVCNVGSMDT